MKGDRVWVWNAQVRRRRRNGVGVEAFVKRVRAVRSEFVRTEYALSGVAIANTNAEAEHKNTRTPQIVAVQGLQKSRRARY